MSDEQPAPEVPLAEQIREFLQGVFNQTDADLGAQIIGDFVLAVEVVTAESPYLRIIDSDLPMWRKLGLVEFLRQDAQGDIVTSNFMISADDDE